jgi:hypothetical protein
VHAPLSGQALAHLCKTLPDLQHVVDLDLSNRALDDGCLTSIADAASSLGRLTRFCTSGDCSGASSLPALAQALPCWPRLQELQLRLMGKAGAFPLHFADALAVLTGLTRLELASECCEPDDSLQLHYCRPLTALRALQHLALPYHRDLTMVLRSASKLTRLEVSGDVVEGIAACGLLFELPHCTSLVHVCMPSVTTGTAHTAWTALAGLQHLSLPALFTNGALPDEVEGLPGYPHQLPPDEALRAAPAVRRCELGLLSLARLSGLTYLRLYDDGSDASGNAATLYALGCALALLPRLQVFHMKNCTDIRAMVPQAQAWARAPALRELGCCFDFTELEDGEATLLAGARGGAAPLVR